MTDKEWNQVLMRTLKITYEMELDLLTDAEFNKWMDFLKKDPVLQSSTKNDEFVEWLREFEQRLGKEAANLLANRAELAAILANANIDTNIE